MFSLKLCSRIRTLIHTNILQGMENAEIVEK